MATPPVFSAGAILTAAQMNAVGLWYITAQQATAGAASVIIDNCFSSDFQNYRIIGTAMAGSSATASVQFQMRFGGANSAVSYYYAGAGTTAGGANSPANGSNVASGYAGSMGGSFVMDIFLANTASATLATSQTMFFDGTNFIHRSIGNFHNVATAYTGITFLPSAGTMNNTCNFKVYGYRSA